MAGEEEPAVRAKLFGNGDLYSGTWSATGLADGDGRYTWIGGSTYEGSWKEGAKHGTGKYTWESGASYQGEWRDGCMAGVGTWESGDGLSRYQGGWRQDAKHGLGRQVYGSGDVYEGLWRRGAPHGPGRYVYADGSEYDGEWRAGRMHGHGTFAWHSGERYDGEWKDGCMHGAGVFTAADGSTFDGTWRRGRKHGVGIYRPATGSAPQHPNMYGQGYPSGLPGDSQLSSPVSYRPPEMGSGGGANSNGGGGGLINALSALRSAGSSSAFNRVSLGAGAGGSTAASPFAGAVSAAAAAAAAGGGGPPGSGLFARRRGPDGLSINVAPSAASNSTARFPSLPPSAPDSPRTPAGPSPLAANSRSNLGPHLGLQQAASADSLNPAEGSSDPASAAASTHLQQQRQQDSSNALYGGSVSTSGLGLGLWQGGSGASGGGKQIFVRVYDKGRLLRETALGVEELEALLPGVTSASAAAPATRAAREERSPGAGGLLRRLRGGARPRPGPQPRPRLGEPVGRGHRSYALMLALQLGIRYSVGRISHEPLPRLSSQDEYLLKVQQEFPRCGSEMTPVHPAEDFTWTDYAPMTFRRLRELFCVDASTYLLSLCSDASLRHLPSPGKSGSVFFLSQDERFFVKTLSRAEMSTLLALLPAYHTHVQRQPHCLLTRFLGLHAVTAPTGRKYRFVVMCNVLRTPPHLPLHRTYDLKGSTLGRTAGRRPSPPPPRPGLASAASSLSGASAGAAVAAAVEDDPGIILKDLDLDIKLRLEPGWRERLALQLRADCGVLSGSGVMDYSLLLGLHFRGRERDGEGLGGSVRPSRPTKRDREAGGGGALDPAEELARAEERLARLRLKLRMGEEAAGDLRQLVRARVRTSAVQGPEPGAGGGGGGESRAATATGFLPARAQGEGGEGDGAVSATDALALQLGAGRVQLGAHMAATAVHRDGQEEEVVLWFAIIDILQPYNASKRIEHGLKSMLHSSNSISVTHPNTYASRFLNFIMKVFE